MNETRNLHMFVRPGDVKWSTLDNKGCEKVLQAYVKGVWFFFE